MKTYRVNVIHGEDGWLVAEAANPRGLVTQGRDLNELVVMIQDAIALLTESSDFAIQLKLPPSMKPALIKPVTRRTPKKRSKRAA